jgi:hypothetical protein
MASKKEVAKPVISEIPMPISDSPLVIDLPDGQKLVVGKMSPGSVIEVATWRGTGRPDSRTSRLMLGMSSADQVQAQAQAKEEIESTKVRGKFNWRKPELKSIDFVGIGRRLVKIPSTVFAGISLKNRFANNKSLTSQGVKTQSLGNDNFEIEAWLDQLTDKARSNKAKPLANSAEKTVAKSVAKKKTAKKSSR